MESRGRGYYSSTLQGNRLPLISTEGAGVARSPRPSLTLNALNGDYDHSNASPVPRGYVMISDSGFQPCTALGATQSVKRSKESSQPKHLGAGGKLMPAREATKSECKWFRNTNTKEARSSPFIHFNQPTLNFLISVFRLRRIWT